MRLPRFASRLFVPTIVLSPMFALAAAPTGTDEPLFPETSVASSRASASYARIPYDELVRLDLSRFEVLGVVVAADLEPVAPYVADRALIVSPGAEPVRYDVVGWVTDRETGEHFRFISPLGSMVDGELIDDDQPRSCTLNETVQCDDGTTVSVTCSGDTGSCISCSLGKTACCKATSRGDDVYRNGRIQEVVVITRESETCPPPPEPRPGEQPRLP